MPMDTSELEKHVSIMENNLQRHRRKEDDGQGSSRAGTSGKQRLSTKTDSLADPVKDGSQAESSRSGSQMASSRDASRAGSSRSDPQMTSSRDVSQTESTRYGSEADSSRGGSRESMGGQGVAASAPRRRRSSRNGRCINESSSPSFEDALKSIRSNFIKTVNNACAFWKKVRGDRFRWQLFKSVLFFTLGLKLFDDLKRHMVQTAKAPAKAASLEVIRHGSKVGHKM